VECDNKKLRILVLDTLQFFFSIIISNLINFSNITGDTLLDISSFCDFVIVFDHPFIRVRAILSSRILTSLSDVASHLSCIYQK